MAPRVNEKKVAIVKKGIQPIPDNLKAVTGLVQAQPGKKAPVVEAKVGKVTVKPATKPAEKPMSKIASVITNTPTSKPMGGMLPEVTVIGKSIKKPEKSSLDSVKFFGTGRDSEIGYNKYKGKPQNISIKDIEENYNSSPKWQQTKALGNALKITDPEKKRDAVRDAIYNYGGEGGHPMEWFVRGLIKKGKLKSEGEAPDTKKVEVKK